MNRKEYGEPLVGIALLAYNQGEYLDDMIGSLKEQTFQDFEIILADDGSDDGITPHKIQEVDYEKIKAKIVDDKNLGNAKRRQALYKKIKNKYILDLSADDILAKNFLEKTVDFLEKNDKYGAVSTNVVLFTDDMKEKCGTKEYDANTMDLPHLLARNQVLGSSLMRKKALDEADLSGGFVRYQDWDRWISMLEAGWKIGLVPEYLFYYRQVQSSLSHSASVDDEMIIRRRILAKHNKSYRKYYKEVIEYMEQAFLELVQGKGWLEEKYFISVNDAKGLKEEVERLKRQNTILISHRSLFWKVRDKISYKVHCMVTKNGK